MDEWLSYLVWLQSLGNMGALLEGVRPMKITHLAQGARSLYPSDLLNFVPPRRFTLLTCLIFQTGVSTRNGIIQMFLKHISKLAEKARVETTVSGGTGPDGTPDRSVRRHGTSQR